MDRARGIILSRTAPITVPPASLASKLPGKTDFPPASAPLVNAREVTFTELGQTGDSFGGLNALLTAFAGALVFWAGYMQHQTLKQAREEARSERANRQIQEFESLFFRLLELTSTAVERIEGPKRKDAFGQPLPRYRGTRALDSHARSLYNSIGAHRGNYLDQKLLLAALVEGYLTKIYDRQPSAFGPYLRLLYQTFKHVADADLPEAQRVRYANIARGQISEGAVLLLALNGLSPNGYKFIPLIEKFGLLEHLHRQYRTEFEAALGLGYRRRSFLGSEGRAAAGNEWESKPLLPEDHFMQLENRRWEADNRAEFEAGFYEDTDADE